MGTGIPLAIPTTDITEIIEYNSNITNRLPSLRMRMNSFFIRNVKRDFDSEVKAIFNPTLENSLMFISTFLVCILMDISNAEIRGTEDAN